MRTRMLRFIHIHWHSPARKYLSKPSFSVALDFWRTCERPNCDLLCVQRSYSRENQWKSWHEDTSTCLCELWEQIKWDKRERTIHSFCAFVYNFPHAEQRCSKDDSFTSISSTLTWNIRLSSLSRRSRALSNSFTENKFVSRSNNCPRMHSRSIGRRTTYKRWWMVRILGGEREWYLLEVIMHKL